MTHGWECVLNPDRPASTMAVPSASAPGSSSQNALGASAPVMSFVILLVSDNAYTPFLLWVTGLLDSVPVSIHVRFTSSPTFLILMYRHAYRQPQQPQQQYTIQHGSLVIPGLGPIVYVMPRSPSSQHGVSSGYTVYHVQSVNGVDHVLATQCDDNYRPISQSVLCGTKVRPISDTILLRFLDWKGTGII